MAKNNETNFTVNYDDEEIMSYKKDSLSAVTFRIVYEEDDLVTPHKKANSFKPDMAHQVFGETEMIFGYRQLHIELFYLHNSAKCCVCVQWSSKIAESEMCKADNIMQSLNPWLPMDYRVHKTEFRKDVAEENHSLVHGEVIEDFEDENGGKYKVTLCNNKDDDFKAFHRRFETLIVWFIDAANFIDLEDDRWTVFYVYKHHTDPKTGGTYRSAVGFCTVYKFFLYPDGTRPRISQFFVLPIHQRRGIGTKLYSVVYDYLRALPDVRDITVEGPTPVFQKIRDFCDSLHLYKSLKENGIVISSENRTKVDDFLRKHKICTRQAQRVFDILECLTSQNNGYREYLKFTKRLKTRIAKEVEKNTRGSKRLCNLRRLGIVVDPMDNNAVVETEYEKYVDSLEWRVNRLIACLAKEPTM